MSLWYIRLQITDPHYKYRFEDFEMFLPKESDSTEAQDWQIFQSWSHSKEWTLKSINEVGTAFITNGWNLFVEECEELESSKGLPHITNIVHNQ